MSFKRKIIAIINSIKKLPRETRENYLGIGALILSGLISLIVGQFFGWLITIIFFGLFVFFLAKTN